MRLAVPDDQRHQNATHRKTPSLQRSRNAGSYDTFDLLTGYLLEAFRPMGDVTPQGAS